MMVRRFLSTLAVMAVMGAPALVGQRFGWSVSAQPPVGLGTAASFAVLAGSAVTNTGPTVISGDLGVSPGTAITGRPPMLVINGTVHANDAVAAQAQSDLTAAYNDAAGRTPAVALSEELGGRTLVPGLYKANESLTLSGSVTLDAQGDTNAVFIFQVGSTLTTATDSSVRFVSGAQACNVFWQVGSSTTLGTRTDFAGTILALTSVTLNTGATVVGRVLARNGAVTLDSNVVERSECEVPATTATTAPTTTTTAPTTTTTAPTTSSTAPTTTSSTAPTTTSSSMGPLLPSLPNNPTTSSTGPPYRLPPCAPSNVNCVRPTTTTVATVSPDESGVIDDPPAAVTIIRPDPVGTLPRTGFTGFPALVAAALIFFLFGALALTAGRRER